MRTFLVTGGAGFIGSNIADALVQRGDRVRVFDNLSTGDLANLRAIGSSIEFVRGDILDTKALASVVEGVDCIFHEAALASVPASLDRPLDSHAACTTGTVGVLDAARRGGVRRVVFASSSAIYGDRLCSSKRETDLPAPISPYGAAKIASENYLQAFSASFGLETVALRYFNVFGPRQDPNSPYSAVIPLFMTAILSNKQPVIYGDGLQSRDFVYVANVVAANLLAADAPGVSGQAFNVGCGRGTSLLEMLSALNEVLGTDVKPMFAPPRTGDVRESMADIAMARKHLGYNPEIDLVEGLRRSIDYYRQLVSR
jgi:UDP-glucose 4-epimerase